MGVWATAMPSLLSLLQPFFLDEVFHRDVAVEFHCQQEEIPQTRCQETPHILTPCRVIISTCTRQMYYSCAYSSMPTVACLQSTDIHTIGTQNCPKGKAVFSAVVHRCETLWLRTTHPHTATLGLWCEDGVSSFA